MNRKRIYAILIATLFVCVGCTNTTVSRQTNKESITYKEFSISEIYADGKYIDTYTSPSYDRIQIYPTSEFVYLYFSDWSCVYRKDDGTIAGLETPFCYDPLCRHDDVSCLTYSSSASLDMVGYDGKVYMLTIGLEGGQHNFSIYDLASGKHEIADQFPAGGKIIARLGRFIYFWIQEALEDEVPGGQQKTVRHIYRYDIETEKIEYLGERSSDISYRRVVASHGEIYYLGDDNHLWNCDYNIQNVRKVISKQISTYEIIGDKIYYLTLDLSGIGKLYCRDLDGVNEELLYENVTWFCMDGETMYYSVYDPIDGFAWDILKTDENGNRILQTYTITVDHGNMIYTIPLEKIGSKGEAMKFCREFIDNDVYIGAAYTVYDGMLFTQFKESHIDGNKKGMLTGMLVMDMESGYEFRINTEVVMN